MKINRSRTDNFRPLCSFDVGDTVQLKSKLRDANGTDPFLLVDLQGYRLYTDTQHECDRFNKTAVVNLSNNKLSYIDGDRSAAKVNLEARYT